MIKILQSCCKYKGVGVHSVGDIVDYESQFNEKALVDGGFAEYVTQDPVIEKEEKVKKTTKEDKTKLQTKEVKVLDSKVEE